MYLFWNKKFELKDRKIQLEVNCDYIPVKRIIITCKHLFTYLKLFLLLVIPKMDKIIVNRNKKTARSEQGGFFMRSAQVFPCFHCGGSQLLTLTN